MTHNDAHDDEGPAALETIIDEVVGLFHQLRALAEQLHGEGDLTAARRGVLRGLDRFGPQTVPQMARARPVSRQHIQMLVNQLEVDGLVELRENVAHKRSRIVALTPRGKAALEAMYRREAELFAQFGSPVPAEALRTTAETLHALHEALAETRLALERSSRDEGTRAES